MSKVIFHAPGAEYLMPYLHRIFPAKGDIQLFEDVAAGATPQAHTAVMISSASAPAAESAAKAAEDVSGKLTQGGTPKAASATPGKLTKAEQAFVDECTRAGLRYFILRAAPIVCTGMQGEVRRLAEDIYRGRFFHLPGNEARMSVVHATDIAAATRHLLESDLPSAVYNITDGDDPTVRELAEALAYRMNDKRISTASTKPQQWLLRMLYGSERLARYTVDTVYSSAPLMATGFVPTPVCTYLRTHVYDHDSL
ncbi:MAG: hypothetical protein K2M55_07975 [Muribaculaceae bacterium]|nr:hypothetical protein [Muribaculaceae bacterium]